MVSVLYLFEIWDFDFVTTDKYVLLLYRACLINNPIRTVQNKKKDASLDIPEATMVLI